MFVPRVFMASSTRAIPLAAEMKSMLKSQESLIRLKIVPWWEKSQVFQPGIPTLGALLEVCKDCDCAIVFLTKDDIYLSKDQVPHQKPRDNCILEAGLFTGALGADPKRCFLVVSVAKEELPSDLMGLTCINFSEPDNLNDQDKCREALESATEQILKALRKLEPYDWPELARLPAGRLLSDEKPTNEGGKLIFPAHVFVNSAQPLERGNEFAERVLNNIRVGCKYRYFFHGDEARLPVIAELIQSFAAAGLKGENPIERRQKISDHLEEAKANLKNLKERLRIYFVRTEKLFYCCIHNAVDSDAAVCYLRYPVDESTYFVKWFTKKTAFSMSSELMALYQQAKNPPHVGIFRSTLEFNLFSKKNEQFKSHLWRELRALFPQQLWPNLDDLCFGTQGTVQNLKAPGGDVLSSHGATQV